MPRFYLAIAFVLAAVGFYLTGGRESLGHILIIEAALVALLVWVSA